MPAQITIRNARLHNLKNITLSLPKEKLMVFTGISGSGKSTLAFDILHQLVVRVKMINFYYMIKSTKSMD